MSHVFLSRARADVHTDDVLTASYRQAQRPSTQEDTIGFRCARDR